MKKKNKEKVIYVETDVKCNKCGKVSKASIPVICEPESVGEGKEALVCDIVGNLEDYVPKCSCGSNDFTVDKKKIEDKVRDYR